jgi:hypothetical protein
MGDNKALAWKPSHSSNLLNPLVIKLVGHGDMFKKFNASEDIAGRQNVKSSVQRAVRTKIVETFPLLEPYMEEIIPKKSQLSLIKWYESWTSSANRLVGSIFRY